MKTDKIFKSKKFITVIIMFVVFLLEWMLINLACNYIVIAVSALLRSLKTKININVYAFSFRYLFSPPGAFNHYITALLAAMLSFLFGYKLSCRIQQKLFPDSELEGSSRWSKPGEIKKALTTVSKDVFFSPDLSVQAPGGYVLAMNHENVYIDTGDTHTLCVGAARSGKTQRIILNTIRSLAMSRQSMIINDIKGELCENTAAQLKACGYKILFFNIRDPKHSHGWNPLHSIVKEYCKAKESDNDLSYTSELISDLAYILTENKKSDPIWPSAAKSLLTALIMYMLDEGYKNNCLDKLNLYSVKLFFLEYGTKTVIKKENKQQALAVYALDEIFDKLPIGNWAKTAYATSQFAQGEMRASINSTLSDDLDIFTNPNIAKLTSYDDIDFRALYDEQQPCAIFIISPDEKDTFNKLTTLFITQSYTELISAAYSFPQQRLPRKVKYIIDECGLLPPIPSLGGKLSGCLSRGVGFLLCVQDIPQIEEKYGNKVVDNIINNCHNKIYVLTQEPKTNKYFSDMLAKGTVNYSTYSGDNGDLLDKHRNTHLKARELMTGDELSRLKPGEIIVIRQRMNPIKTYISAYYEQHLPILPISDMKIPTLPGSLADTVYPMRSFEEFKKSYEAEQEEELTDEHKETKKNEPAKKKIPAYVNPKAALQSVIAICDKNTDGECSKLIADKNGIRLLQLTEDLSNIGVIGENESILLSDFASKMTEENPENQRKTAKKRL